MVWVIASVLKEFAHSHRRLFPLSYRVKYFCDWDRCENKEKRDSVTGVHKFLPEKWNFCVSTRECKLCDFTQSGYLSDSFPLNKS